MSHRLVLSLFCFSVLLLSLVQLASAGGGLKVDERRTRVLFEKEVAQVVLPVGNSSDETFNVKVQIELLDPKNQVASQQTQVEVVKPGPQLLRLSLPLSLSKLTETDRRNLLWYKLRYRLDAEKPSSNALTEGILSLSEIAPDVFEVRVATSEIAREGSRYRARVRTSHPITRRPVADVRVDGEITLEHDQKDIKLRTSRTTDADGYALLDFVMPPRFPQFPHNVRPAGGEIYVTATRGGVVAKAQGEVLVDQFAKTLITTDKPLYQPGQVMHVRALLFSPSRHALANQNILIRICDPDETTVFRTLVTSSRFGVVNTDWTIPENVRLGDYRIWVGVDGDEEFQVGHAVRISRYDLPNFSVGVQPDRPYYLPGQNARIKVRADYLFGQPVARGHVRVVRETQREWNYREQKWDIDEGVEYEGETDAQGIFTANIDLADDHQELGDSDYNRFNDATYAAYFTDATTNRTEQRRFDLRVTSEAIHVYVIKNDHYAPQNPALPLQFYVSTFYADGTPARCNVTIRSAKSNATGTAMVKLRTNRYGLARVSGVRLPRESENDDDVEFVVSAVDSNGRTGSKREDISLDDEQTVAVETGKTLYGSGEPISARIISTVPSQRVVVDVVSSAGVIRSERVQLHNGRGSIVFGFKPDFRDKLTIAAYPDFAASRGAVGRGHELLVPPDEYALLWLGTCRRS